MKHDQLLFYAIFAWITVLIILEVILVMGENV